MPLSPRKIGSALVPPIGFGAMGISAFYGKTEPDEERLKVLDAAFEHGSTHWDTSSIYNDSEVLIGKWLAKTGKRKDIFLATKFGILPNNAGVRGDPEFVKEQCDISLKRLQTDYIDLYYQHRPDTNTPIEITVGAMAELVKEGKVKYLGLSEVTANDIRRAHSVHPISAVQVEFSPFALDIESEQVAVLKTARELGITTVCYSPLGRGLLTGRYKSPDDFEPGDFRKGLPKYQKENFPKILKAVEGIQEIAEKHHATSGQVTLAWILAQGNDFVVIPGTKSIKYLVENLGAQNVDLSSEEVATIRKIAEATDLPADRYGATMVAKIMADTPPLPK